MASYADCLAALPAFRNEVLLPQIDEEAAPAAAEHGERRRDDLIQVRDFWLDNLAPSESKQLTCQGRGAFRLQ